MVFPFLQDNISRNHLKKQ